MAIKHPVAVQVAARWRGGKADDSMDGGGRAKQELEPSLLLVNEHVLT